MKDDTAIRTVIKDMQDIVDNERKKISARPIDGMDAVLKNAIGETVIGSTLLWQERLIGLTG